MHSDICQISDFGLTGSCGADEIMQKLPHRKMEGRRKRRRPKRRQMQVLEEGLRTMGFGRWREKVQSEKEERNILREVKAYPGL